MQSNFNINLPSIPGRALKFKIQDVRSKGFLTRQARFKDDKEYLTKRFINSFANLQPKQSPPVEAKSEPSTSLSSCFREDPDNFRWMVGDDKKNLLIKYQDHYKSYQPPINNIDNGKGFTFPKQGARDTLDEELRQYQSQLMPSDKPIENYYFNMTEQSDDESDLEQLERRREQRLKKKKHLHPTAAFKGEDRWQNKERQIKNKIKPGPGSYVLETIKSSPSPKRKIENPEQEDTPIKQKLKDFLKEFKQHKSIVVEQEKKKKNVAMHNSSIFAEANVDRFGNQKFPTLVKMRVPGPGSYDTHGSMEEKAKKILIVQEQRKLLKEWYND